MENLLSKTNYKQAKQLFFFLSSDYIPLHYWKYLAIEGGSIGS